MPPRTRSSPPVAAVLRCDSAICKPWDSAYETAHALHPNDINSGKLSDVAHTCSVRTSAELRSHSPGRTRLEREACSVREVGRSAQEDSEKSNQWSCWTARCRCILQDCALVLPCEQRSRESRERARLQCSQYNSLNGLVTVRVLMSALSCCERMCIPCTRASWRKGAASFPGCLHSQGQLNACYTRDFLDQ